MIDFQDIPSLIQPYVKAVKHAKDGKIEYTAVYNKAVEQTREIEVHSRGEFPEKLIKERAPSDYSCDQ